ncbi:SDR family oxidoreductase [Brevifollis gellanilyticus]|uniref:Short-chain dehydrogenase n=1 Tax=Brevifollis gellanilyticus TaxID=748831 RepID=A0A512M470_9BACT|nr:SDR family oxidoreductase [Brevifollis gellanilyticus]GEP41508.1 short-chain dehydrogenase [Brevifollis gellanilyticus]
MTPSKIVLITGCTRGLGRAMVSEFTSRGWTVAGCGRDAALIAALQAEHAAPNYFGTCDVRDDAQVAAFGEKVVKHCGVPDLVLNNAAIVNKNAPAWQVSAEEFDRVIDINIKGPANVMRHLLPVMLKRGSGVMVNFSSGWGRCTAPEVAPYCATKYAIEGLSQAAAQETGGKVAIIPLNPGIIDTDMLRSCFGAEAAGFPDATAWAKRAVPFLIKLDPKDNGQPLSVPGM